MQVKVISIVQPWASLAVYGLKQVETRSWNTSHRGELYIHASLKKSKRNEEIYNDLRFRYDFSLGNYHDLPFGCIIGSVNLDGTMQFGGKESMEWVTARKNTDVIKEIAMGDWEEGRWGWLLSNPQILLSPIPVRGKLSIWNFDINNYNGR